MPQSTFIGTPASFNVQGIGLSTYSFGGYADSKVISLIHEAAGNGANYVELSNIVLADLQTGAISDVIEKGVDQTAPLADVGRAIDAAQAQGLNVMLKPQIAVHDPAYAQYNSASWINMVDPNLTIADPGTFFANYKAHVLEWAQLAEQHHVALLSIGNEMVAATKPQYTPYWNDIIDAVRAVYHGQLTYAALAPLVTNAGGNEITQIGFWSKLDYAGFDVYPSLTQATAPTVQNLVAGWHDATVFGHQQDYAAFLNQMAAAAGKPVIFTETGLPSFHGAADRQATTDGDIGAGRYATDQGAQADWWQAFFKTWAANPPAWLKGLIVNNNDPGTLGAYYDQNYNINGKLAEAVVTSWFGGATVIAAGAHTLSGGQGDDQLYLFGPRATGAASQAASLSTTVSIKVAGSILGGAAPVIHAYVNGVDEGQLALKPVDSGFVSPAGVHFTADQTFTFEVSGLVPLSQLKIVMDSPATVGGQASTVVFHEILVDGLALTSASYQPAAGAAVAETLTAGGTISQWAGGAVSFDASPWNAALAVRTVGGVGDPIVVSGQGGLDTVHALGSAVQYTLTEAADGSVRLTETSGLGQNAVLNGISTVAFGDGTQVSLAGMSVGVGYRFGSAGADSFAAGAGPSYLRGGDGADSIAGGSAFDDINGNKGDDTLDGGAGGDDWLVGGQGNDLIIAHASDNILLGNLGADTLHGGSGHDVIRGGQGDDFITAGSGVQWISGDRGNDTIQGGSGPDTFHTFSGAGIDKVIGFSAAKGDHVQLDPGTHYTLSQIGADTIIDMGNGDQMILQNVQVSSLPNGWIFGA
ncbi:MAG: hypothetical protein JWP73_418 [Phenylobacterium sp.]|nr:hypothetical protein [Phenylobacterium sp.]